MKLNKENLKKIRGLILFTILTLVVLWNYKLVINGIKFVWKVISPFVLGGAIAFSVNIPMSFIEEKIFRKRKIKWAKKLIRPLSLVITLVILLGLIATVIWVVVPELGRTFLRLGDRLGKFIPEVQTWLLNKYQGEEEITRWIMELDVIWENLLKKGVDFLKRGVTFEVVKNIISGLASFVIGFVFACYILMQKEKLGEQVKKLMYAFMPEDWRDIFFAFGKVVNKTFTNFFIGQCVEALILGLMFLVVMWILKLPYALLISVLIAFTALIPIFGAFIGCAIGVLLIFIVSPVKALIFLGVFLLLQEIEGDFVYPHVVGSSVGLPSIWVLVAVTIGGSVMGIAGMIIFIPLASVVYTMLRGIVNRRLGLKE